MQQFFKPQKGQAKKLFIKSEKQQECSHVLIKIGQSPNITI